MIYRKNVLIAQVKMGLIFSMIPLGGAFAAEVANHTAATNDRFSNSGSSFIADGYDLSGIGRTVDGNWATRIGDNYFLSANHFHPGVGNSEAVTFFASNDPLGASFTYNTQGGFRIAGTDLWLGYFDESIDSSIATYDYTTTSASSLATTGIEGNDLLTFGNSVTANNAYGGAGRLTDTVVAQNQAESFFEEGENTVTAVNTINIFGSPAGWDQLVTFQNESGDSAFDFQTHESQLQGGDSGSPLFSFSGGDLLLQGIAYATVDALAGNFDVTSRGLETRAASFYSYVGSYESGLNAAIANVPSPIPEPSAIGLLFVGAGSFLLRRKRI